MKHLTKAIVAIATFIMGYGICSAQNGDKILGTYRVISHTTKEKSNVKFYKNGDTYEAQIIWLEHPLDANGQPRLDVLNPNPTLRSVRGDKIVIVKGLRYNSKNDKWAGGKIYDPVVGKTYDAIAEFENPTKLKMKGYIGMPSFGKSFIWTRID